MAWDSIQALVASLPLAAFVVDRDDCVLGWNAAAESLFGVPASHALGVPFRDLPASYRVDGLRAAIEAAKTGRGARRLEGVTVPRHERQETVSLAVALIEAPGPPAVMIVAQSRDDVRALAAELHVVSEELAVNSERMELANEELRITNEALQAANGQLSLRLRDLEDAQEASRHKDDFLAMLAHELRNPLAPIVSATQIIRLRPDDRVAVQRAREIIERQVRHQAQLLDDLLEVSRVARGKIQLRRAPTTLAAIVNTALETTRSRIDARQHEVVVSLPDETVALDVDSTRLGQAVANLLDNAAKYTAPSGRIEIRGRRESRHAVLTVRDTGVGIPPDMLGRVFDLFTQVDAPLARSQGGLGIGLTLARTLVEMHGGSLEAASEGRGRGSEFTLRLPVADVQPAREAARPAPAAGTRKILVVEDNADAREMLRVALELDGHRVDVAADGPAGVDAAVRGHPDVALIDIGLPGLDGYEVARRIRESLGGDVMLVALTGYGQASDRQRTHDAGFDAHLVKPVDPQTLGPLFTNGPRPA
jgi:signal transduction histidine kinase